MEEIWMKACTKLELSDDVARTWYEKIRRKMVQGSGRFYHNWDELLLRKEDYLREVNSSTIVFAVFFQYYEFDGKRNCVEKNCEAFEAFCAEAGLKDANTIKVVKKLLGDETMENIEGCEDEINHLQDLDLLVLGSSAEEYQRYKELLRKEYSHLDDASYKQMRLKFEQQQPSTSGRAAWLRTPTKIGPNIRPGYKKTFKKIKDDKLRNIRSPHNFRKKTILGLTSLTPRSSGQVISRKIVNQIRKRQNNIYYKTPTKNTSIDMSDESTQECIENKKTDDNLDDDCVVIEMKPEIILIEDETMAPAPVNEVKELENKYLKFKHYEAIGSIRLKNTENIDAHMITSTPKMVSSRDEMPWKFNGDASSIRNDLRTSRSSSTDDCTFVQDVEPNANDVIFIETVNTRYDFRERRKRTRHNIDDSVIFVSEKEAPKDKPKINPAPEFIPLDTPAEESHFKAVPITTSTPKPKKPRHDLFNTREARQLKQYNDNAYNPNKDDTEPLTKKRLVIVDGSNVAYCHALNKEFSVKGLKICLDYFEKIGHEVKAVVPQFRLQKQKSTDPDELENLHKAGKIVFTPCKNLPGKSSTSYDDRFILQLAAELDAAIVSNDNYRDLINENSAFKKIIENRVIGYTWCNDIFILPKDPYGKWGPTLAVILNRS